MVFLHVTPADLDGSAAEHCGVAADLVGSSGVGALTAAGSAAYPAMCAAVSAYSSALTARGAAHGSALASRALKVDSSGERYVSTDQDASIGVRDSVAV